MAITGQVGSRLAAGRRASRMEEGPRELERYQHFSPVFRAQTVDLIAPVLFSGTPASEEEDDDANYLKNGGGRDSNPRPPM